MKAFDYSFVYRSRNECWENHGKPWKQEELEKLTTAFCNGADLETLCRTLQRPASGVLSNLCKLKLIRVCLENGRFKPVYYYTQSFLKLKAETTFGITPNKGEPIMNNIETKTFIRGTEASSMSDADIFKLIARLEGEAEVLGKIKVKSVKVSKAIADLNEDVQKLVEYLDSRP